MKILLSCLNVNGLGGSEMYHYELAKELHLQGNDITLFSLRPIDYSDERRIHLSELNVKQVDLNTIDINESYDIIVASQPQTNQFALQYFSHIPIVSIIHSEIRSEDPILDSRIKHYIGIRKPIVDMLINEYKIDSDKVSLIYNPIDASRFKPGRDIIFDKTTGIFVGEVLDNIRFQAVSHLVKQCIQNDWDLYLMSESKYDFQHPNIKYIDKRWDTESVVKNMDFTAGILLGRTTLEGWCCNVPGYIYNIDINGSILNIDTNIPDDIVNLCNSIAVAKQHLELYKNIITNK